MNLELFYDDHVGKVYKFFYIQSLNKHVAEDLTSQTFVYFLEKSKTMDFESPTKYLYGVMRNTWLEFLRSKYDAALQSVEDIEDFEEYTDEHNAGFDKAPLPERLRHMINKIPEKQRIVFVKRVFESKSNREVADELERDINYVKTTYKRSLKTIREVMGEPYMYQERSVQES